jgi:hypothetical protein
MPGVLPLGQFYYLFIGGIMVVTGIILIVIAVLLYLDLVVYIKKIAEIPNTINATIRILFIRVRLNIHFDHEPEEYIAFNLYKNDKKLRKLSGVRSLLRLYRRTKRLPIKEQKAIDYAFRYILRKSQIYLKKLVLKIGIGDAFTTALACGSLNIIINTVFAITKKINSSRDYDTRIIPIFDKEYFEIDADCIIHLKPVHIITGYFKYLMRRR